MIVSQLNALTHTQNLRVHKKKDKERNEFNNINIVDCEFNFSWPFTQPKRFTGINCGRFTSVCIFPSSIFS